MNRLRATAKSYGTYYATGCPSSLTGKMIFIENPTNGICSYTGNAVYNSAASPGVVILAGGELNLSATIDYHGLIYAANRQGTAPASGPCTSGYKNDVINLGGNVSDLRRGSGRQVRPGYRGLQQGERGLRRQRLRRGDVALPGLRRQEQLPDHPHLLST